MEERASWAGAPGCSAALGIKVTHHKAYLPMAHFLKAGLSAPLHGPGVSQLRTLVHLAAVMSGSAPPKRPAP